MANTQIEAMRLALEALEICNGAETVDGVVIYTNIEINALDRAIAEAEKQEPATKEQIREAIVFNLPLYIHPYVAEPQQPKAEKQEPVACVVNGDLYFPHEIDWQDLLLQKHDVELLYTHPQPKVEQVDAEWLARRTEASYKAGYDTGYMDASVKSHEAQPKREPLTDEQIMDMYNEPRSDAEMLAFARAIEAAHGIKGEA